MQRCVHRTETRLGAVERFDGQPDVDLAHDVGYRVRSGGDGARVGARDGGEVLGAVGAGGGDRVIRQALRRRPEGAEVFVDPY